MREPDAVEIAPQPVRRVAISLSTGPEQDPASVNGPLGDRAALRPAVRGRTTAIAVAATALAIVALSPTSGLIGGAIASLLVIAFMVAPFVLARAAIKGIGATLGQGFLGYRPDNGWPHGVQEEYDVKWDFGRARAREN